MRKLILFDLDGTLVDIFEEHLSAFLKSQKEVFGVDLSPEDLTKNIGQPARIVIGSPLLERGIDPKVIEERMETAYRSYKKHLEEGLKGMGEDAVLPGAVNLLEILSQRGEIIGLVTSNISTVGMMVIEKTGIAKYFRVQSFGDVANKKSEMISRAVELAREKYGFDSGKDSIFFVGDGAVDVRAGKEFGCRTVALATGMEKETDLEKEKPDFLFSSLENTEEVLKAFGDQI